MARVWAQLTPEEVLALGQLEWLANNTIIYKDNTWVIQAVSLWANWTVLTSWWTTSAPTFSTNWSWDVVWPASSIDLRIALFDWTTWKLIQDSWELLAWLVHTTGAETIWGVKTLTDNFQVNWTILWWVMLEEWWMINWQIVTSVASWNLTVALKTMNWTDPSATDPVYVRIDNVVRTISGALSTVKDGTINWSNIWSTELITKEVDFFTYLGYNVTNWVQLGYSRIPNAILFDDFSTSFTNEKYFNKSFWGALINWDKVVNIWRFNATLSVWAPYTWSIPATSIIINRPVYETRVLTANLFWYWATWSIWTYTESHNVVAYQIMWSRLFLKHNFRITNMWSWTGDFHTRLPFSTKSTLGWLQNNWQVIAQNTIVQKTILNALNWNWTNWSDSYAVSATLITSLAINDWISIDIDYEI